MSDTINENIQNDDAMTEEASPNVGGLNVARVLTRAEVQAIAARTRDEIRDALRPRCRDELALAAAARDVVFRLESLLDYPGKAPEEQQRLAGHFRWRTPVRVPEFRSGEAVRRWLLGACKRAGREYQRRESAQVGPRIEFSCPRRRGGRTVVPVQSGLRIQDPIQDLYRRGSVAEMVDRIAYDPARFGATILVASVTPCPPDARLVDRAERTLDDQRRRLIVTAVAALDPVSRARLRADAIRQHFGRTASPRWRAMILRARRGSQATVEALGIRSPRRIQAGER